MHVKCLVGWLTASKHSWRKPTIRPTESFLLTSMLAVSNWRCHWWMLELSQGIVLRRCSGRESVPAQKGWTWRGLPGTDLGFALAIWPTAAGRGRGLGRGMTETRLRENEDSWRTSLSTPQVSEEHGWMVAMIGPERELTGQALIENAALTSKGIRARFSWATHCGGSW